MIYSLMFKTPDVLDQLDSEILPEDKQWIESKIRHGEYITVKFDTENKKVFIEQ